MTINLHTPKRPWMAALESQALAERELAAAIHALHGQPSSPKNQAFLRGRMTDHALICAADAYSWSPEITAANLRASKTIPEDTRLSRTVSPIKPTWFWFTDPLNVQIMTSHKPAVMNGLLAGWLDYEEGPTLALSCYLITEGGVSPATKWFWTEGQTLDDMAAGIRTQLEIAYGKGGVFADEVRSDEADVLKAADEISRFYLSACVWMTQKIPVIVATPAHVERHRRKQLARETKVRPEVSVIELRRTERSPSESNNGDSRPVDWKWQWQVDGHHKNQRCGPGGRDRKLIYVHSYWKGPEGKPIKPPSKKVYQVDR